MEQSARWSKGVVVLNRWRLGGYEAGRSPRSERHIRVLARGRSSSQATIRSTCNGGGGGHVLYVRLWQPVTACAAAQKRARLARGSLRCRLAVYSLASPQGWHTTLAGPLGFGRAGPRSVIPYASRLWTGSSASIYAASTSCSLGGSCLVTRACGIDSVHWASWTAAVVVCTWVRRWGAEDSHVSLMCPIEPVHWVSRWWR